MTRVFLAEDDDNMVNLLATLLQFEGFQILIYRDLTEPVVQAVLRERPDILLLDVHLPNENGLDVIKSLRANDELKDLSVVMTSGLNLKSECMMGGADEFLLKPYMPDELIRVLNKYSSNGQ